MTKAKSTNDILNGMDIHALQDLQARITAKIKEDADEKKKLEESKIQEAMAAVANIQQMIEALIQQAVDIIDKAPKNSCITLYVGDTSYDVESGWVNSSY